MAWEDNSGTPGLSWASALRCACVVAGSEFQATSESRRSFLALGSSRQFFLGEDIEMDSFRSGFFSVNPATSRMSA